MKKSKLLLVVSFILLASMVLSACAQATPAATEPVVEPTKEEVVATDVPVVEPTAAPTEPPRTTRKGGWLDEIVYSVVSGDSALTQLTAGAIDIYANGLSSKDLPAIKESGLSYSTSNGLYYDIMYNPAGPVFANGTFNPFANRKIREATNMLFDRDYINQEIYAGGALPKWFAIQTQGPDYADLADKARELEAKYAYNLDKAKEVITAEMEGMGATLVDGVWQYDGKDVTLIYLIRNDSDGTRLPMGDYTAAQFEKVGFKVDRQYKKGSEASAIWIGTDPTEGAWHLYTAAWSSTVLDRDQSNIFQEMYLSTSAQGLPVFQQNVSDEVFQKLGDDLYNAAFTTVEQRHDMMAQALELSLQDSLQVFLIDGKNFIPYRSDMIATADMAAGVESSKIYPFTLRFKDKEGGTVKWATQDMFIEPFNPVAGGNWTNDKGILQTTQTGDYMYDPYTGLVWPLRIEKADVVAKEGLPIGKTLDWVTLAFEPEIKVPGDAWVDWDAATQTFITADTKFPDGQTALIKTTTTYPADMFDVVKWHDGSNLSIADFVMSLIMTFDRAKEDSAIYDPQAVPALEVFSTTFKGFKIVSESPLTIEYYTDSYSLDAELCVAWLWPSYANNVEESDWDFIAVANLAEAGGELAYSVDKATEKEIEQTSDIGGPSLEILAKYLDQAIADKYVPYAATLGNYLTADEAVARYEALKAWYAAHNHFKVGTGPYYIDQAFLTEKSLVVKHFDDYPDLADRWSNFGVPKIADVTLDGPGQVKIGEEAIYDIAVTYNDEPYAASEIKTVKFLLYDATGAIVTVGEATLVADGQYQVVLPADVTTKLAAGSNKLEIAVVPLTVSQPTFSSLEFVTAP